MPLDASRGKTPQAHVLSGSLAITRPVDTRTPPMKATLPTVMKSRPSTASSLCRSGVYSRVRRRPRATPAEQVLGRTGTPTVEFPRGRAHFRRVLLVALPVVDVVAVREVLDRVARLPELAAEREAERRVHVPDALCGVWCVSRASRVLCVCV